MWTLVDVWHWYCLRFAFKDAFGNVTKPALYLVWLDYGRLLLLLPVPRENVRGHSGSSSIGMMLETSWNAGAMFSPSAWLGIKEIKPCFAFVYSMNSRTASFLFLQNILYVYIRVRIQHPTNLQHGVILQTSFASFFVDPNIKHLSKHLSKNSGINGR